MGGRAEDETRKAIDGFGRYFWLSNEPGYHDGVNPHKIGIYKKSQPQAPAQDWDFSISHIPLCPPVGIPGNRISYKEHQLSRYPL